MKYTLIIDSVAALPESVIKARPIEVLPVTININGKPQPDKIDEAGLIDIYNSGSLSIKSEISTAPPSSEQIQDFILTRVVPYSDFAICQSLSRTTSPVYDNFADVGNQIAKKAREVRADLGIETPFRMTTLNTGTTIAGQGLVAIYGDLLLSKGTDLQDYTKTIDKFTKLVKTYVIVRDLVYTRKRSIEKGVKTVGIGTALIGKTAGLTPIVEICNDVVTPISTKRGFENALDQLVEYAIDRIKDGLYVQVVNISYAGDLEDLYGLTQIKKLQNVAKLHKVKVFFGIMGLASSSVYGPGGFSIGIAPKNQVDKPG